MASEGSCLTHAPPSRPRARTRARTRAWWLTLPVPLHARAQDCSNGRGTCLDPRSTPNSDWDLAGLANGRAGFVCSCPSGWGGLFCDGALKEVTLSANNQGIQGTLAPGEWSYLLVNIDTHKFNYK